MVRSAGSAPFHYHRINSNLFVCQHHHNLLLWLYLPLISLCTIYPKATLEYFPFVIMPNAYIFLCLSYSSSPYLASFFTIPPFPVPQTPALNVTFFMKSSSTLYNKNYYLVNLYLTWDPRILKGKKIVSSINRVMRIE